MGFNSSRVEHQVKYLGLLENVRVRKAGHSYRTMQDYFTNRFFFSLFLCFFVSLFLCFFVCFVLFHFVVSFPHSFVTSIPDRYGILCTKTDEEQVPYDINVVIDWIRKNVTEINVNDEIHLGKEKVLF